MQAHEGYPSERESMAHVTFLYKNLNIGFSTVYFLHVIYFLERP